MREGTEEKWEARKDTQKQEISGQNKSWNL